MHFSLTRAKQFTILFPMKKDSFVPSVPCVKFAYVIKAPNLHYPLIRPNTNARVFLVFNSPYSSFICCLIGLLTTTAVQLDATL